MEYPVNKGAGNPVEFKGLKSQYLFVFAGGLAMVLLMVVFLYLTGVDQWICLSFEHGLMKLLAEKRHPRYLIHRKRVFRLFTRRRKKQQS